MIKLGCINFLYNRRPLVRYYPRLFSQAKNAFPEVPLQYYQATKRATQSINHRLFYINWIFVIGLMDLANSTIDF